MPIISAKNLYKTYLGKAQSINAVNGVSLDINRGDFLAVTGESGSGKSTLLYLMAGLETPTSGAVAFDGKDYRTMTEKEKAAIRRTRCGFVYQFYNLLPDLNVYDNIALPLKISRRFNANEKQRLLQLADMAQISAVLDKLPAQISGGEQQRAAIIRAVIIQPEIIFMDEPTGNLDAKSAALVNSLILDLNSRFNTAIVMVTHSQEQAKLAKTIAEMTGGVLKRHV